MKQARLHTYNLIVTTDDKFEGNEYSARLIVDEAFGKLDNEAISALSGSRPDQGEVLSVVNVLMADQGKLKPSSTNRFIFTVLFSVEDPEFLDHYMRAKMSGPIGDALADYSPADMGAELLAHYVGGALEGTGLHYWEIEEGWYEAEHWREVAIADARTSHRKYLLLMEKALKSYESTKANLALAEGLGATNRKLGEELGVSHQMISKMLDGADERNADHGEIFQGNRPDAE